MLNVANGADVTGSNNAAGLTGSPNITVGIATATKFVKSSGTSSQFLKADGSVDSSTYLTSVGTNNISDDAVTTAKLAADSVTEAKIADNAVTHDKYQEVATDTIIGRTATGTGIVTALSATEVRGIINVANGAQANVDTNLSVTRNATSVTIVSSTGDNATIGEATGTNAGAMTSSMHDKLDGIATGADVTGSNNAAGLTGSPDISVNTATITGGTLNVGANSSNLLGEVTIFKGDDFSTASQPELMTTSIFHLMLQVEIMYMVLPLHLVVFSIKTDEQQRLQRFKQVRMKIRLV